MHALSLGRWRHAGVIRGWLQRFVRCADRRGWLALKGQLSGRQDGWASARAGWAFKPGSAASEGCRSAGSVCVCGGGEGSSTRCRKNNQVNSQPLALSHLPCTHAHANYTFALGARPYNVQVRAQLVPQDATPLRYSGSACWRGRMPLSRIGQGEEWFKKASWGLHELRCFKSAAPSAILPGRCLGHIEMLRKGS